MADIHIHNQRSVTWIEEVGAGFPPGSVGRRLQATARAEGSLPPIEIVDRQGDALLSSLQLDATVAFAEFLAGNAFTEAERHDLRTTLRLDFATNPYPSLVAFDRIIGAFVQIPALDPERRAMERLAAQAATTFTERSAGTTTAATTLIERYNPVLHVDDVERLVLTADALDAYWSLYDTIADIVGAEPSTSDHRVALSADLPALYATWSRRIRSETCHARGRWVALRASIRAMDEEGYDDFARRLRREVTDSAGVAAAVTGFGMAAGATAMARRVSRRWKAAGVDGRGAVDEPATGVAVGATPEAGS